MPVIVVTFLIGVALGTLFVLSTTRRASLFALAVILGLNAVAALVGLVPRGTAPPTELSGLGWTIILAGVVWPLSAGLVVGGLGGAVAKAWRAM